MVYSRLNRLFDIIHAIAGKRGITGRELAQQFTVDERTIRRDIETLNASGIPCHHDRDAGGYIVRKGFFLPPVEFTFEEALSLLTLMEQIPDDEQIPYVVVARKALRKIRSQLRDDIKNEIEQLDGKIQISLARGTGNDGAGDVYEKVRQAIASRRTLRCRYQANHSGRDGSEEEVFELRPYLLWYGQRAFYVIGLHLGRDEVRQMKLNRFDFIEVTDKPYAIPDDFSIKSHLGNAWRMIRGETEYKISVRFDKHFATTVADTRWHPTQAEAWNEDGTVTLTFTVAGLEEIQYWVLSYGSAALVLEPKELAEEVRKLAEATARRYAAGP